MVLLLGGFFVPGAQPECSAESLPSLSETTHSSLEGEFESELLILTNQQRVQQGLQELVVDPILIKIAREHSFGMARQGFISHELPSGDLKTRMSRGGYVYRTARENVASARSVINAQNALMDSPPHHSNILASDVNRVGIGIVRCAPPYEKELFITEIFASPREEYRLDSIEDALISRVGTLRPDPVLERLATSSVQLLSVPVKRDELRDLLANSADELHKNGRTEISRVDVSVQLLHDPNKLKLPNQARLGEEARMFGTAVRQVLDSRNQSAFLVLTLIGFAGR
jgi:uncharacterized protein YkwD